MDTVTGQKWLIGIFSVLLIVVLIIVAGVEMKKTRLERPEIEVSGTTKECINCHAKKGVAVKLIDEWRWSEHAEKGIGCHECHEAREGDFDAMKCPESSMLIAKHPTPGDCRECHERQVKEFANSKHAVSQSMMALKGPDRNVFEPPVTTKHGCEQCHHIGNFWPDESIGECDACHSKHRFDIAQAGTPRRAASVISARTIRTSSSFLNRSTGTSTAPSQTNTTGITGRANRFPSARPPAPPAT